MKLKNIKKNSIIILAIVVLGSLVLMVLSLTNGMNIPTLSPFEQEIACIESQSNSDNIEAIEQDLTQTDLDNLDQELQSIEAELNQAYQ
jgi:hypothetical protein